VNLAWAVLGAAAGLPLGAVARGTVLRLSVPAGLPDRSACPRCAAPVPGWATPRCRCCGAGLAAPGVLELATAGVLGLLLGRFAGRPEAAAFGFLGVLGVCLAAIDLAVQRLPDRLTLPAYPAVAGLLGLAAVAGHDLAALARSLLGGLVLIAAFSLLALARPGQLGGGDVKLAGLVGLALGWLGWPALVAGTALGFVLAALASLVLLATRRITLRSTVSFGPWMLAGALVAALLSSR
jgi:leader peptidase (prepilin peptidase)/N-methyltransferase